MMSQVTGIATEVTGESIAIHVTANSAISSITVPRDAAGALARLLTAGTADSIAVPDWLTPAEIKAARAAEAEKAPA